jgi:uncharacterized membrane protein
MPAVSRPVADPGVLHPIRRAMIRGLAVVLPPLLTVLVFLWAWNMIDLYILSPCEHLAARVIVWSIKDVKSGIPEGAAVYRNGGTVTSFDYKGKRYVPVDRGGRWIPDTVKAIVDANPPDDAPAPATANAYYDHYVHVQYLRRERTLPLFLAVFILILYLTGKLMAARIGLFIWQIGEGVVQKMPIVRNVYSAAKQITDSIFGEQQVPFTRVVAVEWPRKGVWTLAFVTGEGFKDIHTAAGEDVVSLLVPTSPMPATGFTCTVPVRDTIALDITVDQAVQFIVSCGVVIPPHQQWSHAEASAEISRQVRQQLAEELPSLRSGI